MKIIIIVTSLKLKLTTTNYSNWFK